MTRTPAQDALAAEAAPEEKAFASASEPRRRVSWLAVLPLALFAGLALLFGYQLAFGPPADELRSALVGRPAPTLALPVLDGAVAPDGTPVSAPILPDPEGRVSLVNVFASWCAPCRAEHPAITALAARPDTVGVGLAYKDDPVLTNRFLAELGNPFERIGVDRQGRAGLDLGVTGVPETFVVGPDGTVLHAHRGPVDAATFERIVSVIEDTR